MCVLCGNTPSDQVIDHTITHPFALKEGSDYECETCDQHLSRHPDKMEYLKKREMETIIEYGHQVRYVFPGPDDDSTAFAYSMGRSVKDRPEILVTGQLPHKVMHYIVNRVADLDDERELSAGMELAAGEVLEGYPVRLVQVSDLEEAEMFGVTSNFGTDDTSALQVVWPDLEGRFPDEEGFTFEQPIFDHSQTQTHDGLLTVFRDCQECGSSVLVVLDDAGGVDPEGVGPETCAEHS